MKHSHLAISIAAASGAIVSPAIADSQFLLRVPLTNDAQLSNFKSADAVFTDWKNVGSHHSCQSWSPSVSTVDFGSSFVQSRNCQQSQERVGTPREYDKFSDTYKELTDQKFTERRNVAAVEQQSATGTRRNWGNASSTFTAWEDFSSPKSHTQWAPKSTDQKSTFTQTRSYKQPQEQFEQKRERDSVTADIRNVGAPLRHTREDARTENRRVDVTSGAWFNTTTSNFGEWSPKPASQDKDFSQSRQYTQHQERKWTHKAKGSQVHTFNEKRALTTEKESRTVTATPGSWSDTDKDSYTTWSPEAKAQKSDFTQLRNFSQNQVRTWSYKADGAELSTRDEIRAVANQQESRSVSVDYSEWANKGSHYECGAWSPDSTSAGYNEAYTQHRDCKQSQERIRSYKTGSDKLGQATESKVITEQESRQSTGTGNWAAHSSTFTQWTNDGAAYAHGTFSPAVKDQTRDFFQRRNYKQNQFRMEQKRERDVHSGTVRNVGDLIRHDKTVTLEETRDIRITVSGWSDTAKTGYSQWAPAANAQTANFGQSRAYTQGQKRTYTYKANGKTLSTRDESRAVANQKENRSVVVSWSAWTDSGAHYECGTWSPATNTKGHGEQFTQSRSCKQNQSRNRIYKVGAQTIETKSESRTINETETQAATGVGTWSATTSTFTAWTNEGARHTYGSWSPAASAQTKNFTQSRSYKQNQFRMEQKRERDSLSGKIRNVGSPIKRTQTVNASESRSVTATPGSWSNTTASGHTGWTPAPTTETSSFTQSRKFTQAQKRTWSYKAGSTTLSTREETRALSNQNQTRSVTVTWSAWTDSGAHYECGTWSPATNTKGHGEQFTQSRSCKQNQSRNRIYKVGSTTISTKAESRIINETETQAATGVGTWSATSSTFTTWTNEGARHTYGSWSPAASAQTKNFTQSRSYKQNQYRMEQKRERDSLSGKVRNVGSPIKRTQTVNASESRSVVVTASNWSNTTASGYTGWTPAPTTETSSFTQSRKFTQAQKRTWSYKVGSATLSTREETRALSNQNQTRSVTVTWSGWTDKNGHYSCGAWSPATNTKGHGEKFTQSRSCKQNQSRNRIYKVGSTTIGTKAESRTINETETQAATGVGTWSATSSTFTTWTNEGARHTYGAWSPAASSQTKNFTQSRSYKQDQFRMEQKRERDSLSGKVRNVGSPIKRTQTVNASESRSVVVTAGSWSNTTASGHTGWTPAPTTETSSFTQSRKFTQAQKRTWSYKAGSTTLSTREETRALSNQNQTRSVTVTWSGWTDKNGHYSCGAWSPATNTKGHGEKFTQSRSCKQNQSRSRIYKSGSTTVSTKSESRTINETETQAATGVGTWSATSSTFTTWTNEGNRHSHGSWLPAASSQTKNFTQSRSYKQNQFRMEQKRERDSLSGKIRNVGSPIKRTQTVNASESRSISVTWSGWTDKNGHYSCGAWSPATNTKGHGEKFTQSRSCKQDQTRNRIYKSGSTTVSTKSESRTINETETQAATGVGTWSATSSTFTSWTNEGARHTYGSWSPAPSSQTKNFTQSRSYKQNQYRMEQKRERDSLSGKIRNVGSPIKRTQTVSDSESRTVSVSVGGWSNTSASGHTGWSPAPSSQTSTFTQSRKFTQAQKRTWSYKVGSTTLSTRDETRALSNQNQTRSVTVTWSGWTDKNGHYSCGGWTPATNTKAHGQKFTQSRSCKQDQTRSRIYKSGSTTVSTKSESRTINETENRSATGIGSWSATSSTFTSWTNEGNRHSHGSWSPAPSSQTKNFTQSRSYKQNQYRMEQKRERDSLSGKVRNVGSPIKRTQTVNASESRTVSVSVGGWSNTTASGHTGWTPAPSSQTSTFTQSRKFTQAQKRTWSYKVGSTTLSTRQETRALSNQNQTRSVTVTWSGWTDKNGHYSCGGWTPATNTKAPGASFTQSRSCKQDQTRSRIYKAGSSTVSTKSESRTINETETRSAKGVGNWSATSSTFTAWTNEGAAHTYGSWSPAASTQTSNFTQSRSYKQNQYRYEQKRERDSVSGAYRNVGSRIKRTQTINKSQSRSVTVSVGSYSNTTTASHTSWTPAASAQTSNFTQTRKYTQNQTRTWTYKVGSSTIKTRGENRALSNRTQSRTIAVSWSGWADNGGHYSCGSYSPATSTVNLNQSFTQTRSCKQNQKRTRYYKSGSSTVTSKAESRTINENETRSAKGTKNYVTGSSYSAWSGWSNSGGAHTCGSYSPAASSQRSNFTQTRTCKQNQTRTRTKYTNYANGTKVSAGTETGNQTVNVTQSRTVTVKNNGWVNSGSVHSCSGYSPATNTVASGTSFTQTRTCKQTQKVKYTYSIGGTYYYSSRTVNVNQTRSAKGTKPVASGKWTFHSYAEEEHAGWVCKQNAHRVAPPSSCNTSTDHIYAHCYYNGRYAVGAVVYHCK